MVLIQRESDIHPPRGLIIHQASLSFHLAHLPIITRLKKTNRKTQQKTIHPRLTPQKAPFTPAYGSHAGNPVILLISLIFCVMILTKPHDNHVFQRLSRTCSSQQEIIFANFQACIQAFMPGYRLFFTLLLGESLGGMQKPNTKPNTEPFPNCCFSHDKGVLGSNFRDAFCLKNLS